MCIISKTEQSILQDYLTICNQFPTKPLGKKQRCQRHQALMEWQNRPYDGIISIAELFTFWKNHADLPLGKPFCIKVVVPSVLTDLERGNTEGIRFLFESNQAKADYDIGTTEDFVEIFCAETGYRYQPYQLADMLLTREPQNQTVLRHKYLLLKRYIEFSIHEVPYGILNGMNGAEASALPAMLRDLEEFAEICRKLTLDEEALIRTTSMLYHAYETYLQAAETYNDFADYLEQHQIPY